MRTSLKTLSLFLLMGALVATVALAGGNKANICHVPPDNPDNWHTITVSVNAVDAHLAHGDLLGTCLDNCETLCDDGDICSVDACDPVTEQCLVDHPPVDCDDHGNLCTIDSCDPVEGCLNIPIDCSDNDLCTLDVCDPLTGGCGHTPVVCSAGEVCDPATGNCVVPDPCEGVVCEPLDQCHVAGVCTDGVCDNPVAPDGTTCDDGDAGTTGDVCTAGVCSGTPAGVCEPNPCPGGRTCVDEGGGNFRCECTQADEEACLLLIEEYDDECFSIPGALCTMVGTDELIYCTGDIDYFDGAPCTDPADSTCQFPGLCTCTQGMCSFF